MKKSLQLIYILSFIGLSSVNTFAQSTCASALTLTPGSQQCGTNSSAGDFDDASGSPTNPCDSWYNDGEYWFQYTANGSALQLDVTSLTATYSGIYVLDGCPSGSPTCEASYSAGSSTSNYSITTGALTNGNTYYIVIANWASPYSTGFCLDATEISVTPPSNDDCATPTAVTVNSAGTCTSMTAGTITFATNSGETACTGTANDDVWYTFTAPATGSVDISLQNITGSTSDLVHEVMAAAGGMGCGVSNVSCSDPNTSTATGLTPGTTYYIRVHSYGSTAQSGNFDLCVSAGFAAGVTCYSETNPSYSFLGAMGTSISFPDDQHSALYSIGFNFCFMGTEYTDLVVSSNGYVTFRSANANTYSTYVTQTIPTTLDDVLASVLGPWHDIDPNVGGTIRTKLNGTSPNRQRIITFDAIPLFSSSCGQAQTHEIVLYETSNIIDVNIGTKDVCTLWNSGNAVLGLNGPLGVNAVVSSGRNNTNWSASNETTRWTPTCTVCPTTLGAEEFTYFDVQNIGSSNEIIWGTSEEKNVAHFEVQRSFDAVHYETIKKVKSLYGNSETEIPYSYLDENPQVGINYYRVKRMNTEGEWAFTPFKSVTVDMKDKVNVYPNPTKDNLYFEFISNSGNEIEIFISDMSGRKLLSSKNEISKGQNKVKVDLSELPIGVYFYQTYINGQMEVGKVFVD